jgi:hypothetical protein
MQHIRTPHPSCWEILRDYPGFDLRPMLFFKFGPVVGGCCNSYTCTHNFAGQRPESEKPLAVYELFFFFQFSKLT